MNKYFKRFLNILCALLLTAIFLGYFNEVFRKQWDLKENSLQREQEILKNYQDIDVLYLGSSGLYASVSPVRIWDQYKISGYNLSTSEHNFVSRYYRFKSLLSHTRIKIVVVDMSFLINQKSTPLSEYYEPYYKNTFNCLPTKAEKIEYLNNLNTEYPGLETLEYWFPFIKHHNNWDKITEKEQERTLDDYKMGGLLDERTKEIEKNTIAKAVEFDDIELKYFEIMINLANENDIEVIGIMTPKAKFNKNAQDAYIELSEKLNFTYFKMNDDGEYEGLDIDYETDFYNEGHLNIKGNRKFSDYLGGLLEKELSQNPDNNSLDDTRTSIYDSYVLEYNEMYAEALDDE